MAFLFTPLGLFLDFAILYFAVYGLVAFIKDKKKSIKEEKEYRRKCDEIFKQLEKQNSDKKE